jgi:hypothetical protein
MARLYARSDGVFRSTDHGRSWTLSAAGLPGFATALAAHPSQAETVYAGTIQGVFVSHDRAQTWQPTGLRFDPPPFTFSFEVRAIAIDPSDPARMYAGTWEGLYVSADGGATWQRVESRLFRDVTVSQIAVASTGAVYVGSDSGRISLFVSTDGGVSWRVRDRRGSAFTALAWIRGVRRRSTPGGGSGRRRAAVRTACMRVATAAGRGRWRFRNPSMRRRSTPGDASSPPPGGGSTAPTTAATRGSRSPPACRMASTASPSRPIAPRSCMPGPTPAVFEVESVDPCRADCGGDGSVGIDDLDRRGGRSQWRCRRRHLSVADRDANGRIEIAEIIAAVRDAQRPCANIPEPAYLAPRSVSLPALPFTIFAADIDRDGLVDALTVSERAIALWRGDGAGGFAPGSVTSVDDVIIGARGGDLDGDGAMDVVLTTSDGKRARYAARARPAE